MPHGHDIRDPRSAYWPMLYRNICSIVVLPFRKCRAHDCIHQVADFIATETQMIRTNILHTAICSTVQFCVVARREKSVDIIKLLLEVVHFAHIRLGRLFCPLS